MKRMECRGWIGAVVLGLSVMMAGCGQMHMIGAHMGQAEQIVKTGKGIGDTLGGLFGGNKNGEAVPPGSDHSLDARMEAAAASATRAQAFIDAAQAQSSSLYQTLMPAEKHAMMVILTVDQYRQFRAAGWAENNLPSPAVVPTARTSLNDLEQSLRSFYDMNNQAWPQLKPIIDEVALAKTNL